MTNSDKIIDYFHILHHKLDHVLSEPHNLPILAGIILVLILAFIAARLTNKNVHTHKFPKYLMQRVLFPFLVFCGVLVLSIINVIMTAQSSKILHLFILLSLAGIVIKIINTLIRHAFSKNHYFGKFNRLISLMLWIIVLIMITDENNDMMNLLDNLTFHLNKTHEISVWDILHGIALIIIASVLAMLITQYAERRISRIKRIDNNLQQILIRISKILIFIVALMITLSMIGVDVTTLSVFGGAIGVGIGFGLQKITSNFLSGFIILFDRSIKVGDRLIIENNTGVVRKITTRYVVMERFDGTEVLIPNETFVTSTIQNQSYSNTKLRSELTFNISDNNDINQALQLIKAVIASTPNTITNKASVAINNIINNGVEIKAYFWVNDPNFTTDANNYIYINIVKLFKDNAIITPQQSTQKIEITNHEQPAKT